MRLRTLLTVAAVGLLAIAAAPAPDGDIGDTTDDGRLIVGLDPEGDWGRNVQSGTEEVGAQLSQDLVGAYIGMDAEADEPTVDFVIEVTGLPENGGVPEITRYVWNVLVNGEQLEIDGKWSNYSRGACDPTSGQCPPPRDPGMQPFILRGNCTTTENVSTCEELGIVHAAFDPSSATITIPVPLALIGAEECSVLGPGTNFIAGSVSASPSAFLSYGGAPADTMFVDEDFVVPTSDGTPCPEDA